MIRNLSKLKSFLLLGAALLLTGLFAAGCTTTFLETSGKMPNQNTSKHVKGYQMGNSEAQTIRPVIPRADVLNRPEESASFPVHRSKADSSRSLP